MSDSESGFRRTVSVDLGERSYPICIGRGIAGQRGAYAPYLGAGKVLIVTNETIAPLHLEAVSAALETREVASVTLADGERYKNMETLAGLHDALLDGGFDRECTVLALGGGVIGDVAGFAAATYQRGVALIQIPTTLLALVDSSVGGKTGVNHPRGKNMIGAFHQPRCVIADPLLLETLPDRQLRAGLAEVIKYALISDYGLFQWLERHMPDLLARTPEAINHIIEQSCRIKARVVAEDERESGARALLNLGHTFGHAIETATGYSDWLHGEAVAAGLCMAARLSCRERRITATACRRAIDLVHAAGLPTEPPDINAERFRKLMERDKKAQGGRLRLVLLQALGNATVTSDFDPMALQAILDDPAAAPA